MAEFPQKAKVVIVGLGGIVGASVAHHLIERGWDDIVGQLLGHLANATISPTGT